MSVFEGSVFGTKNVLDKLDKMNETSRKELEDAVSLAVLAIHGEAVRSINAHLSSGATYGKHVASKEGSPPNTDTGVLVKSIQYDIDTKNLSGVVGTNLKYGAALEFGTKDIGPRPWLSRAFREKAAEIVKSFDAAFRRAIKP